MNLGKANTENELDEMRGESSAELTPNNPPWTSSTAFFLWAASVGFMLLIPSLLLLPYLFRIQGEFVDTSALLEFAAKDETSMIIQVAAVIPAHLLTLLLAYFVVTNSRKYSFFEMLGMKWGGFNIIKTFLVLLLVLAIAFGMTSIFGEADNSFMELLRSSRTITLLVAFIATFSAPIVEEVVYRGVLYSAFRRSFGIPMAILAVTLIFASVHFPQYWGDWATISSLIGLSLILTMIRERTRNLLPCIFIHFLINGIQSSYLVLEPYLTK